MRKQIIFIVGPTASGKSGLALRLARKIKGELISCDSMQVYKGLRIISNKPSRPQLRSVPHHLVGTIEPHDDFNANKFVSISKQLIGEIFGRGKVPIFVGGTGLYMDALLYGLFEGPAAQPKVRLALYKKAERYGNEYLYQRLKKVDPKAARRIHPNDIRRIVRALEVYQITKKPISLLQKQRRGLVHERRYAIRIIGIRMPREKLYEQINRRVEQMFSQGAVSEIRRLLGKNPSQSLQQALGIKEISLYLSGQLNRAQAQELLKKNTRHYAKRQHTWFRRNKKIQWFDAPISVTMVEKYLRREIH